MKARQILLLLAGVCLLPAAGVVARHMPAFGNHPLPTGETINRIVPEERHVANMVSAVNFDVRGLDTLGEEFILLAAVTGTALLLRGQRGEHVTAEPGHVDGRKLHPRSDAAVFIGRVLTVPLALFGMYIVLHATTTPGGGFQGGAIVGSALLISFLGEGYGGWRRLVSSRVMDALEGASAAGYALCGLACLAFGLPFLGNVMPLGQIGDVFSGGLMLVLNVCVGVAVAGGFAVMFGEFLEETRREDPP